MAGLALTLVEYRLVLGYAIDGRKLNLGLLVIDIFPPASELPNFGLELG